tara:strand:+ start:1752 stop:2318 length:567 start_codon:yes stop_codon:yes gene_type:complete
MNKLPVLIATLFMTILISCGGSSGDQPANAEGFSEIEKEIKEKFGDNAYFTELSIIHVASIGNSISTTVTDAPESLAMGQWTMSQGNWNQTSDVTLEIPEGTKAADFMFQLDDAINLSTLGGLVQKSMKQLTAEKDLENPMLSMAFVKFPKNGDLSETNYVVQLEPENGGTTFSFFYTLNGELIEMDY